MLLLAVPLPIEVLIWRKVFSGVPPRVLICIQMIFRLNFFGFSQSKPSRGENELSLRILTRFVLAHENH